MPAPSKANKVILNCVWFSHDGSVPIHVIDNLKKIKKKIKKSNFSQNYELILWTDTAKLSPVIAKELASFDIKFEDYRTAFNENDPKAMGLKNRFL